MNKLLLLLCSVFPMKVSGNLPLRPFINHAQICTGIRRNLNEQFSILLSQELHWENRTNELKRTIARQVVSNVAESKTALSHQNVTVIWWPWINSTNFNNPRWSRPGGRITDDLVSASRNYTLVLNLHPSLDCL